VANRVAATAKAVAIDDSFVGIESEVVADASVSDAAELPPTSTDQVPDELARKSDGAEENGLGEDAGSDGLEHEFASTASAAVALKLKPDSVARESAALVSDAAPSDSLCGRLQSPRSAAEWLPSII
jgi:hypothetical protein